MTAPSVPQTGPLWGFDDPEAFARGMYGMLNAGDLEGFLASTHPEVRFRSLIAESEAEHFEGHDGVRKWAREVAGALGGMNFEAVAMERHAGGMLVDLTVHATAAGTRVSQRMWQAVAFRDGLVTWWQTFRTRDEALAGLAEQAAAVQAEPGS